MRIVNSKLVTYPGKFLYSSRLLKMSKEFPFINDDAEGLREGNKIFEEQFWRPAAS